MNGFLFSFSKLSYTKVKFPTSLIFPTALNTEATPFPQPTSPFLSRWLALSLAYFSFYDALVQYITVVVSPHLLLSLLAWCKHFTRDASLDDIEPNFRSHLEANISSTSPYLQATTCHCSSKRTEQLIHSSPVKPVPPACRLPIFHSSHRLSGTKTSVHRKEVFVIFTEHLLV